VNRKVADKNIILYLKNMDDAKKMMMEKMMATPCPKCGSDKMYGMCCGMDEAAKTPCPCDSGKMCSDCMMKDPGAHKAMMQ
jgi:hypothetical protein